MQAIKQAGKKTYQRDHQLTETMLEIIDSVRSRGDATLLGLTQKLDHADLECVKVDRLTIEKAYTLVDQETMKHIAFVADQIRRFAQQQLQYMQSLSVPSLIAGVELGHRLVLIENCGCYIPSGHYPLPSSALMSVAVAKVAGVRNVAACSPAFHGCGTIHPAVLVAMDIAGADDTYCMGDAQAIVAYAYGTGTVRKVDLIIRPGSKFVTEAKRQVLGDVGIDSPAGPSEVLTLADETANPTFAAIDLLDQAEHDPNAKPILVCTNMGVTEQSMAELNRLPAALPTRGVATISWEDNGEVYLADSMEEAITLVNQAAPEHLEVQIEEEQQVAAQLYNYGSLFAGHHASVAFGDLISGTNHILPTMSTARYSNGLHVKTFTKTSFHQYVSQEGCKNLSESCIHFAQVEGLHAHRDSVRPRVE